MGLGQDYGFRVHVTVRLCDIETLGVPKSVFVRCRAPDT